MMGHRASVHVVDPPLNQWDGVLHIDVTITAVQYSDKSSQFSALKSHSPHCLTEGGYNICGFKNVKNCPTNPNIPRPVDAAHEVLIHSDLAGVRHQQNPWAQMPLKIMARVQPTLRKRQNRHATLPSAHLLPL